MNNTNIDGLKKILHNQMLNNELMYPWTYGRVLYDKYFEEFNSHDEELDNQSVQKLLKDTYQGVFQLGTIISGPLGALESDIKRFIPPTKNVKLWHCSDHSCNMFHSVELNSGNSLFNDIENEIGKIIPQKKADHRRTFIDLINPDDYYYDINRLTEFPILIVNAFGNYDIKELLKELISSNQAFREKLPNLKKLKGSPQSIVANLNKAECFQLILLQEDNIIVSALEKLIENKTIVIPPTEIRSSDFMALNGGFFDIHHQCNKLGVRSIPLKTNLCVTRLINLIERVYSDEISKRDLEYRLMNYKKDSFRETIENYILHEEPKKVVSDCLLYGLSQTEKSISELYGNFRTPSNENEKKLLIDKLLWKLGFEINIYPSTIDNFFKKIHLLKSVTNACNDDFSENEKESIRSVAVNFFVLLEEVLEHSLSYITWTLLSDHYLKTKFRYNFEDARDFMCKTLNGYKIGSNVPLRYDNTGNNTLFPLVEGFAALIEICDKSLKKPRTKSKRPESEIPHYYDKTELITFPLLGKTLLVDIKSKQYEEIKSILCELHREFSRFGVISVRNKLEDKERKNGTGDSFPSRQDIIEACECIESILKKFIEKGIYPNVFLFKNSKKDKYNRISHELEDYEGNTFIIKPIPSFTGLHLARYHEPQVVSPIITIGNSNEPLRFKYEESSEYLKFWKDFPRKKILKTLT